MTTYSFLILIPTCWYIQGRNTPLLFACLNGHSDVAQLLINKGAHVDVTDEVSYMYLCLNIYMLSCEYIKISMFNHNICIYILILNLTCYIQEGYTPLLLARLNGLSDVAQLLNNNGCNH